MTAMRFDYTELSGLENVFLEDSFVLAIKEEAARITFRVEAVLTPEHPCYGPPRADEEYCFATGDLLFSEIEDAEWTRRSTKPFVDANNEPDWGNIDEFDRPRGNEYRVSGHFGVVNIICASDPVFLLDDCPPATSERVE